MQLFGFKNPFIQRLLRELVADINGIAERSLVSSNICDGLSRTEHGDCSPNLGTHPDLLLCLGRPRVTGKRSKYEIKDKKLHRGVRSRATNVKNEKSLGQGSSTTHCGSEEIRVHNHIGVSAFSQIVSPVGESSNCISSKNGSLLIPVDISDDKKLEAVPSTMSTGIVYSTNCKTIKMTGNLSTEEPVSVLLNFNIILSIIHWKHVAS